MPTESVDLVQLAVSAAKAGKTGEARLLLGQLTRAEPENDTAWLWLAGVAESPQESLFCLEKVLEINPGNDRAQASIKTVRLQAGVAACQAGDKEQGRQLLQQVIGQEPASEQAWLWLAAIADTPEEAIGHLKRVLEVNPGNERALSGLNYYLTLQPQAPPQPGAAWNCPFCNAPGEEQHAKCYSCKAMLHLGEPELFLANPGLNAPRIKEAVLRMEYILANPAEETNEFQLHCLMGLGYLNLRQFEEGMTHLRVAASVGKDTHELRQQIDELLRLRAEFEAAPGSSIKEALPKMPWASLTIMVVDTQSSIRKLASLTMKRSGFKMLEASDGYELGQSLQVAMPDLVFLQYELPGANGYQLSQMLRNNPQMQQVPIILMSTKDGFMHRLRGRWAGCSDFITKPFEPEDLLAMVRKHCEAKLFPSGKPPSSVLRNVQT